MRVVRVFAAVTASIILLVAVGCGGDPAEIRADLQALHSFVSEKEMIVGPGYGGKLVKAHWELSFEGDEIRVQREDYFLNYRNYQVDKDGNITVDGSIRGHYERDSGRLEWDGRWYVHR